MNRLQHLRRDERGMSFVFVGVGFLAFVAATTLAIDVGMFMTARSQAQTAADAGALAGVTALVFDDYDDRSAGGPAVLSAINTALFNGVMLCRSMSILQTCCFRLDRPDWRTAFASTSSEPAVATTRCRR